jgi:hypothetical protein
MLTMIKADNLSVSTEDVEVDYWERNDESLELLLPTQPPRRLPMLGLGRSVGTGPDGIEAEVVVVDDLAQLNNMDRSEIAGKIVLFNTVWSGYSKTVASRTHGAVEAEKLGKRILHRCTPGNVLTHNTRRQSCTSAISHTILFIDAAYWFHGACKASANTIDNSSTF